jgi:hypothetical protein
LSIPSLCPASPFWRAFLRSVAADDVALLDALAVGSAALPPFEGYFLAGLARSVLAEIAAERDTPMDQRTRRLTFDMFDRLRQWDANDAKILDRLAEVAVTRRDAVGLFLLRLNERLTYELGVVEAWQAMRAAEPADIHELDAA